MKHRHENLMFFIFVVLIHTAQSLNALGWQPTHKSWNRVSRRYNLRINNTPSRFKSWT
jgi:hypothetical protein